MRSEASATRWLALPLSLAALAWDPLAPAVHPKRVLGLGVATVGLALVAGVMLQGRGARRAVSWSWGVLGLVALAVLGAVSLSWGAPGGTGEVAGLALGALVATLAATQAEHCRRDAAFAACLVTGGVTTAVVLAQAVAGLPRHGGQGDTNHAGIVLGMALWPVVGLGMAAGCGRIQRVGLGVLLLAWCVALVLAESRTTWAAVIVGGGVALLAHRPRPRWGGATVALLPVGVGLAVVLFAGRIAGVLPGSAGTALQGRAWLWASSWRAALDALPLGVGAGAFPPAFLRAQADALAQLDVDAAARAYHYVLDAHSDPLHLLVVVGPLGFVLFVAALSVALADHVTRGERWLAAALATTVVCASGDGAVLGPAVSVLLGLLVAAGGGVVPLGRKAFGAHAALVVGAALLLALESRCWVAERLLAAGRDAVPPARLGLLERARAVDPRSGRVAFELGLARLEVGDAAGARAALHAAVALTPGPTALVALGNAEVSAGEVAAGVESYRAALALDPGSFRAHANLASALTSRGRLDEARVHLEQANELYPGHPRLAEIAERLRRFELDRAAQGKPLDAGRDLR